MSSSLFEKVGGLNVVKRVHKIFYDKIYQDEWLGPFFKDISQEVIENQQTDFIVQTMGGPQAYLGAFPKEAHQHMLITEEMFDHRHQLLSASLQEAGVSEEARSAWLKIDGAFRKAITKKSIVDCQKRFPTDELICVPKPGSKVA